MALDEKAQRFSPRIFFTDTALIFDVPEVARYRIDGGHLVTIEAASGVAPDAPEIRLFFFGTVLAILCFRRGLIPLHASAVVVDGRALLISGDSGMGKSTLAAALVARGYPLLSDDLCALDLCAPDDPMIRPCMAHLKLWKDSAEYLDMPTDPWARVRKGLDKFRIPIQTFMSPPMAPGAIIMLDQAHQASDAGGRRLWGTEALRYDLIHRYRLGLALGYQIPMLSALAALAKLTPIIQLKRVKNLNALPDLVDSVLALARDEAGKAA